MPSPPAGPCPTATAAAAVAGPRPTATAAAAVAGGSRRAVKIADAAAGTAAGAATHVPPGAADGDSLSRWRRRHAARPTALTCCCAACCCNSHRHHEAGLPLRLSLRNHRPQLCRRDISRCPLRALAPARRDNASRVDREVPPVCRQEYNHGAWGRRFPHEVVFTPAGQQHVMEAAAL